jgi:nitrilase
VVWVSANATGPWGPLTFPGRSKIVDPDGVVLASVNRTGSAFAEVDVPSAIESVRMELDHLSDRRPRAYGTHAGFVRPLTVVASSN